jgi:hypothetical protein
VGDHLLPGHIFCRSRVGRRVRSQRGAACSPRPLPVSTLLTSGGPMSPAASSTLTTCRSMAATNRFSAPSAGSWIT